jgi:ArsR family transcriptional regulator, arsenate/arsenite/antimonite-responsive transcriptional repressor
MSRVLSPSPQQKGIIPMKRGNRRYITKAGTCVALAGKRYPHALDSGNPPKWVPTMTEDEAASHVRLLKALADPTRLRLLSLLSRYEGEVCVFELVESFTLEQPTISHHLRILRAAGLVDCRKKGLWAYYYVRREALARVQDVLHCLIVTNEQ